MQVRADVRGNVQVAVDSPEGEIGYALSFEWLHSGYMYTTITKVQAYLLIECF